jgi:hypothetical protein
VKDPERDLECDDEGDRDQKRDCRENAPLHIMAGRGRYLRVR